MSAPGGILYADADGEAAFAVSRFLRRAGNVRVVETLSSAEEALKGETPALFVVDPDLPDGSALELIADLHAREPWVQIFVLCRPERADQTSLFIAAGASDVAIKPFDVGTLPSRVARLLRAAENAHKDLAYRQQLEARLQHADRIATLGTLCATVAHEIANPLMLITANATSISRSLQDPNHVSMNELQMIGEASHDVQLAASMIETFIAKIRLFSRRGEEKKVTGSLGAVLDTALLLLKPRVVARNVTVTKPLGPAPSAPHFPIRLTQALLNVMTNALEAVSSGGQITARWIDGPEVVGVEVLDNGVGLPSALDEVGKQPFFTTKENGTGLGLMVIRTIMKEHNGRFELIARTDGAGTAARLILPREDAPAVADQGPSK